MKTKIEYENEYEKLTYDFWNLSELKELFERGELYYNARDYFFKFETLLDLGVAAGINDTIYRRVEPQTTLEDELNEIIDGETSLENIIRLSEILKRHEK